MFYTLHALLTYWIQFYSMQLFLYHFYNHKILTLGQDRSLLKYMSYLFNCFYYHSIEMIYLFNFLTFSFIIFINWLFSKFGYTDQDLVIPIISNKSIRERNSLQEKILKLKIQKIIKFWEYIVFMQVCIM